MADSDVRSRALETQADPPLRTLPPGVAALLRELAAPPRLAAHLRLVHEVAGQLADWLAAYCPGLPFAREAVLFGAATHDVGKAVHTAELSGPGSGHEAAGRELLLAHGFTEEQARFAATHAGWAAPGISVEELLVSTADKVWKGKRVPELENLLVRRIAEAAATEPWAVFLDLDELLGRIADGGDRRLAFQAAFPV
ncbi:HD domain-containing protein [Streptomyces sp. NPDC058304]|uniref:HD domain-containing protein n=1 Tax=Streptomyces sp. NPDC058304 TaxID=3346437 RepID=UPI0036E6C42C